MISNIAILFSTSSQKIPKSGIFVPKFRHFCFAPNFALTEIQGVDFKNDNDFFEFQSKSTLIKCFCPKCKYFVFLHENSHIKKFGSTDFENDNNFFQIPAENTQIRNFL